MERNKNANLIQNNRHVQGVKLPYRKKMFIFKFVHLDEGIRKYIIGIIYCCRLNQDQPLKWYKFDDGEVTECKMEDDEEMKNQCFGGEYLGEVFDHMLKR